MTTTPALTIERCTEHPEMFQLHDHRGRPFADFHAGTVRRIRELAPYLTEHQVSEILADLADPAVGIAAVTFGIAR